MCMHSIHVNYIAETNTFTILVNNINILWVELLNDLTTRLHECMHRSIFSR